ncbi:MAG: S8 family serine peptidase, partial [Dehalococcoidia bacterium]
MALLSRRRFAYLAGAAVIVSALLVLMGAGHQATELAGRRSQPDTTALAHAYLKARLAAQQPIAATASVTGPRRPPAAPAGHYRPGEVLVRLKPGTEDALAEANLALGTNESDAIPWLNVFLLQLPATVSVDQALDFYSRLPFVEYVEPNYVERVELVPNDTDYGASQAWYYEVIEAPAGWDIETGDESVVVAVLDTGIQLDHPDLAAKLWTNPADNDDDGVDDDGNGCVDDAFGCNFVTAPAPECDAPPSPNGTVDDDFGHGTFVAGIVGAESDNTLGVAGVAWGATILPVKIGDCTGTADVFDVIDGIDYAVANGARIMATMLYEMERRDAQFALETMCIGGGQGIAAVIERV